MISGELEPVLRLGLFASGFLLFAVLEVVFGDRPLSITRWRRWPHNLGLMLVSTIVARLVFPAAAVGVALFAEQRGIGLFPLLGIEGLAAVIATIVILDLVVWGQHVVFHRVPLLFRLHRVHHADNEFDVSLATRFHPLEIVLSMAIKSAAVIVIGAPPLAVLVFEVILNLTSMFNHANIRIPGPADRVLRWIVVTPGMHRIHHSVRPSETNANFGFNLPWWDRLAGVYRASSADQPIVIGLPGYQAKREQPLSWLLLLPFQRTTAPIPAAAEGSFK